MRHHQRIITEAVPSNALERVLWLEADARACLKVDDEQFQRNQRDVVKEEARVNVLNQPYGGFPWLDMGPVAGSATGPTRIILMGFRGPGCCDLADVQKFFRDVLRAEQRLGDVKPEEGFALKSISRRFRWGTTPPFADLQEPPQKEERRGHVEEKFGDACRRRPSATRSWRGGLAAMALLDQALHGPYHRWHPRARPSADRLVRSSTVPWVLAGSAGAAGIAICGRAGR